MFDWDRYHRRALIGYELAQDQWGKGLAQEALRAILRFAFEQMDLNRVEIWTSAANQRSLRLARRLGFALDGTLRRRILEDDGRKSARRAHKDGARQLLLAGMKRALVFMLSTSLSQGCTPAMRQYAGAGMILVGAGTTLVATHLLAPCLGENTASAGQPCSDGAHTAASSSKTGVPLLVGGLSLIVAGGMVLAGNIAGHTSAVSA